jgi:hypothetical protein
VSATPQTALQEAEDALHKILTTGGVARLGHNGKWVDYHPANIAELKAYIARLRTGRITTVRISSSKGF